jgi:cobalamin biosynthesis protein CbiG
VAATELVIGIGCQRGTPAALIERAIDDALARHGLDAARVCALATIDRKRDERGLLAFAARRDWPISFYSASELGEGVAEPAAKLRAGNALLIPKLVYRDDHHALTLAIAELAR